MKKKIISVLLTVILVTGLSATAMTSAAYKTQTQKNASATTGAMTDDEKQQLSDLKATIIDNKQALLKIEEQNTVLTKQLRTLLDAIETDGQTLSADTIAQLKALKTQLQEQRKNLASTNGQYNSLMAGYKNQLRSRNYGSAAGALQQVIAVQETRITAKTEINSILTQMVAVLSAD